MSGDRLNPFTAQDIQIHSLTAINMCTRGGILAHLGQHTAMREKFIQDTLVKLFSPFMKLSKPYLYTCPIILDILKQCAI